jgi:hypothetical protein
MVNIFKSGRFTHHYHSPQHWTLTTLALQTVRLHHSRRTNLHPWRLLPLPLRPRFEPVRLLMSDEGPGLQSIQRR